MAHVMPLTNRRGISLLEVLISIGVTSVGLLGVLALVPLGGAQARQGQVSERAPVIGLSAFAEIRNRDMLRQANWLYSNGTNVVAGASPVTFCLDPLSVATNGTTVAQFPQYGSVNVPRLTLSNGAGGAMSLPMAKSIFMSQDDLRIAFPGSGTLLLDAPADRSLSPQQVWNQTKDSADPSVRRQSAESMSWLMTVHPNWALGIPANSFTVSVAVINRRILDATVKNEFTASVTAFPGGGVSGGDVVLTFDSSSYSADDMRAAKLPENSWLLLAATGQVGSTPVKLLQWYRVLASDTTGPYERQVTLSGPDWNTALTTEATIIPGTVAVYQRNLQLESSTLWRH